MIPVYDFDNLMGFLKERPARTVVQREEWTGDERPGDEFNRLHSEAEVLEWLGFTFSHTDHQGEHWTRPGKDSRDGPSATVYKDEDGSHVTVWSDTCVQMWPRLELRRPYDPFGLFVTTHFEGDYHRAAVELERSGYGQLPDRPSDLIAELEAYLATSAPGIVDPDEDTGDGPTGWEPIDLVAALDAGPPPPPDLFPRADGVCLLYRRKLHFFYGPPGSLKSWAAIAATVWTYQQAMKTIYIDFENDPFTFAEHLREFGLTDRDAIRERIIYLNPDKPYSLRTKQQLSTLLSQKADLLVVDGVSNAMNLLGKSPIDHDDIVAFEMMFLRPLTASGAAVIAIDHSPKNTDNATLFGGQHKKAAVTGASFHFRLQEQFGRGMHGFARMELDKDKGGYLQRHADNGAIADLHMHSDPDTGQVRAKLLLPGQDADFRPTGIMESISRFIERHPGATYDQVLSGRGPFGASGLAVLREDGYVVADLDGLLRSKRPFREEADLIEQIQAYDRTPDPEADEAMARVRRRVQDEFPDVDSGMFEDVTGVPANNPEGVCEPTEANSPVASDFFLGRDEDSPDLWGGFEL